MSTQYAGEAERKEVERLEQLLKTQDPNGPKNPFCGHTDYEHTQQQLEKLRAGKTLSQIAEEAVMFVFVIDMAPRRRRW